MSPTEGNDVRSGVRLAGVGMAFAGRSVLHGVDLDLPPGQVTALLGANGAGKSTLIKVLSGVHAAHSGEVFVDGAPARLRTPAEARRLGIHTVHQRIAEGVVPTLTVAENLVFDALAARGGSPLLSRRRLLEQADRVQAGLGLGWGREVLRRDVAELGVSDQQSLILARALAGRPRLLILDEPTSALSATEAERLIALVQRLRADGIAVLYVSHRLGELEAVADRVAVLRDGGLVEEQRRPFDWDAALHTMLAQAQGAAVQRPDDPLEPGAPVLTLRQVPLLPGRPPQDLELRAGEVTGVVGLLGAGKTELARGLFGAEPFRTGELELDGAPYRPRRPGDAIRAGVLLVPEDRHTDALIPDWSIAENLSLPFLRGLSRAGMVRRRREAELGREVIARLGVVTKDEHTTVDDLSGGNQQKVVVGRWLGERPRALLLDEPFRGVDIGARRDLGRQVRTLAAAGTAVVVLSADVDEVLEVADRVLVIVDGEFCFDARGDEVSRDAIVSAFTETGFTEAGFTETGELAS